MARSNDSPLREAVITALGGDAVPLDELRARLGAPWDQAGDDLERLVQMDPTFTKVSAGRAYVPALVEGTTWTVRLDALDADDGVVRMHPDLSALGWWLICDDVEVCDEFGESLGVLETTSWMIEGRDTDVVLGPEGWLDDVLTGWARVDVIDGALRWSPLEEPPSPTAAQVAAMRTGFERAVVESDEVRRAMRTVQMPEEFRIASGEGPIHEALLVDRSAFRDDPIPPLGDLYGAAGLTERHGLIAAEGFDWDAFHQWQERNRWAMTYDLDPPQLDELASFLAAFDGTSREITSPPGVVAALDDGVVASAAWDELGRRRFSPEAMAQWAASAPPSIGQAWLQARALDLHGAPVAAMELLEAAVDDRCTHRPALLDLAGFRADRGNAAGAMRLLVQAGVDPIADEDEFDELDELDAGALLWDEVEGFATRRPRPMAGRNDPCPCGSGRKYKACHLGRETHSLEDRARWLYLKAGRFLRQHDREAATGRAFMRDLVLHEGSMFAEFLDARGPLLPDDELRLARQWALVDRGVFEVLGTTATEVELRNITTDDRVRIVDTETSQVRPGMLLLGRPLPVGDRYRAYAGFAPVPPRARDAMLEAIETRDSGEIIATLAEAIASSR